jgi:hypothetical protein
MLISDMYPVLQPPASAPGHIVFHISDHHAKRRVEALAQQLTELNMSTGLRIALLTIGKAPGHADDGPLDKLQSLLGDRAFRVDSGKIEDIIQCIATSKLYCGTSLHGAITALAYAVPQVALLPNKVIKLSSFLETWAPKYCAGYAEVRQLSQIAGNLLSAFGETQKTQLQGSVEALKARVRANLDHMIALHLGERASQPQAAKANPLPTAALAAG